MAGSSTSAPGCLTSLLVCICLSVVCFGVFFNSLDNEFVFDDHLAIVNNADTDPSTTYWDLWKHDIWGKDLMAHDSHRSYRPLLIITFKALRSYFGLDARSIRIASILSHAICSVLVYFLGIQVISNWHVSFASSLLFALHPVHVESVAAVVNIAEPLSCMFFVATLLMYFSNMMTATPVLKVESESVSMFSVIFSCFKTTIIWSIWIAMIVVAVLFKETAITVLGIVFGTSILNIAASILRYAFAVSKYSKYSSILNDSSWILLSLSVLVGYFVFRAVIVSPDRDIFSEVNNTEHCESQFNAFLHLMVSKLDFLFTRTRGSLIMLKHLLLTPLLSLKNIFLGSAVGSNDATVTPAADISSFYLDDSGLIRKAENPFAFLEGQEKVYSVMYLHFQYLLLMIWPVELSPEYAYNCIPSVATFEDEGNYRAALPLAMYAVIIVASLCGFATLMYTGHIERKQHFSGLSLLVSVMLMVVPFIPAAGVFLRLGTLLAERLLYVPSIGFCYTLCICLFLFSKLLCRVFKIVDVNGRKSASAFWGLILSIALFYGLRTHRRNVDWKSDTDLFLASLDVCPNSAKLNLQVTKIYVNRGDYALAEKHIAATKRIDPDFCDIWYQEALLNVFYYNNVDEAVSKLSDSLSCIFTSTGALQMLQQIWNQEIERSPKDYKVYERIADIGFKAEMYSIAVQYYQQGAVMATEQLKYSDAMILSRKTEKSVKHLHSQLDFESEENSRGSLSYAYREMKCNMYGLGGLLRSRIYEDYYQDDWDIGVKSNKKKKQKYSKSILKQVNRLDEYVKKAIQDSCVYEVSHNKEILVESREIQGLSLSNYATTVLNIHIGNLSSKLQKMKLAFQRGDKSKTLKLIIADASLSLGSVLDQASKLYREIFRLQLLRYYENVQISETRAASSNGLTDKRKFKNIQKKLEQEMQDSKGSRNTALSTVARLYLDAGETLLNLGNSSFAKSLFEHVIKLRNLTNITDQTNRQRKEVFSHPRISTRARWLEDIIEEKKLLPDVDIPCEAHYWYARTTDIMSSALVPMVYDTHLRNEIWKHLTKFINCVKSVQIGETSSVSRGQMTTYAKHKLEEIDFIVKHADGEIVDP